MQDRYEALNGAGRELSEDEKSNALEIHKRCLVVDTHCDTLQAFFPGRTRPPTPYREGKGLRDRSKEGHLDLPKMQEGGIGCQAFAIFVATSPYPPRPLHRALDLVDIFYRECERNRDQILPVTSHREIMEAKEQAKVAALLSIEGGGEIIEADIAMLRVLYRLGARMMSLTWNHRNQLADGVRESRTGSGLTNLGVEAIEEMKRLGMVIDVSHLSDSSFWSLAEIADVPIIASHSNCREICDHPRNLTDDQIGALAKLGGVIGMNFAPHFLRKRGREEGASVKDVADHIDHIVELVGVDHVGLGSDYDGISSTPRGLEDAAKMPNVTIELVSRGYGEAEIEKILGGNHLRVFSRILR